MKFFSRISISKKSSLNFRGKDFFILSKSFFIFKKSSSFFKKESFFRPIKMRFSIQEQNGKKMFFHVPAAAHKATRLHLTTIKTIHERGGNPIYHRKFDNKLFEIRKEDPIKLITIEGEDFFSLEEIQAKFNLSSTKFLNQVKNDKFAKKIDWISPELFPGNATDTEEIDELEVLREEMKSQFEKFQEEMKSSQAEIERLSSRVETLEKEKAQPEENSAKLPVPTGAIFKTTKLLSLAHFEPKAFANFIRWGIIGQLSACTPLREKYVLLNTARTYLPDLIEQIITNHLIPEHMVTPGSELAKVFFERNLLLSEGIRGAEGKRMTRATGMIGRVRRLDPETIHTVAREMMKLI